MTKPFFTELDFCIDGQVKTTDQIVQHANEKVSEMVSMLRRASNTIDSLGFVSIDGDKASVDREAWSDAMAMRDEIDFYLKHLEGYKK